MKQRPQGQKPIANMTKDELNQYKYAKAKEAKAKLVAQNQDPYLADIIKAYWASRESK